VEPPRRSDRRATPGPRASTASPPRTFTRAAFYSHLWLGVLFTVVLTVIAVTGILLNHKRGLGLMPDVPGASSAPLGGALPLARLAEIGVGAAGVGLLPDGSVDLAAIDRMDVRPRNGYVKLRLRDAVATEVTVDIHTGRVLDVGARGDVFLERLHSGEAFGGRWVLLSDAAAIALVVTLLTGYWLWLAPKLSRRRAGAVPTAAPGHRGEP
jgi:hypothetical protein